MKSSKKSLTWNKNEFVDERQQNKSRTPLAVVSLSQTLSGQNDLQVMADDIQQRLKQCLPILDDNWTTLITLSLQKKLLGLFSASGKWFGKVNF